METKQATQATTSKNLKYETSRQKAALLIKQIGCILREFNQFIEKLLRIDGTVFDNFLYFSEKSKQNEDNVDIPVFKYDICKKNYSNQGNLTRHIKNIHGNEDDEEAEADVMDDDEEQFLKKGKNHEGNVTRCNH